MELNLCAPCAEKLRGVYTLRKVREVVDGKIQCAECGRRRYGATYLAESKNRIGGVSR